MGKSYRILISMLAIVFSLAAACIGFALVGNLSIFSVRVGLSIFSVRVGCSFIFIMQFIATVWCVIILWRTKMNNIK